MSLMVLSIVSIITIIFLVRDFEFIEIAAINLLNMVFLITGTFVYVKRCNKGIISAKNLLKWLWLSSLAIAIFITIVGYSIGEFAVDIGIPPSLSINLVFIWSTENILSILFAFVEIAFISLIFQFVIIFIGFGFIWFSGWLVRVFLPSALNKLRLATFTKTDFLTTSILLWLMDVPRALEPHSLMVEIGERPKAYPWNKFFWIISWELFLGTILAIYVSFNPMFLDTMNITGLLSTMGLLSVIIPVIVVPLFIILAIQARIPGTRTYFLLYHGIRSRILQTFVALGTLFLLIRLALARYDPGLIVQSFLGYYTILGILSVYFTFVYLNYFEHDLAIKVVEDYERGRE